MSSHRDFSLKPFARGVLKDIPSQFMPMGGLTDGYGIRIDDAFIERRKGFRSISDCEYDDYILGIKQYRDPNGIPHIFFGDKNYLYHLGYSTIRSWDDGYPWWDVPGNTWDALAGGIVYRLTPWGSIQVCPSPSLSSNSSSSSSTSESSSSISSFSSSSSQSCTIPQYPFSGREKRDASGETSSWIFTDFGGNIIATNYDDPIVLIRGYNYDRYKNLTCMGLRARIVDTFQGHILALNTVDGVDGQIVNRYWWSGLGDCEDWDYTNLASESGYSDIEPSSMPITAGARLRDSYIIYQENMIHQLNYTGGALVFSRQTIDNEKGCLTKGLLCGDGEKHFFFGQNDIWMNDGYSFKPIGMNNNRFIFGGLNRTQISRAISFIDGNTNEAHFVIPWESEIPNLDCIYDYIHDVWTFDDLRMNGAEGATAGCPKNAFDYPYIARVGWRRSVSSSSSSSSSSSCSTSSSKSSSSSSYSSQSRQSCAAQCTCMDDYIMTILGCSGVDGQGDDCSTLNGIYTLNNLGICIWEATNVGSGGDFEADLRCQGGYWILTITSIWGPGTSCKWRAPNYDGCPPAGVNVDWECIAGTCDCGSVYLENASVSSSSSSSRSSSSASYECGINLIDNYDFENWSNGPVQPPDGWSFFSSSPAFGGTVDRDPTIVRSGLYSARVFAPNASMHYSDLYKSIMGHMPMSFWRGRDVTVGVWIKTAVANKVYFYVQDGVGTFMSAFHNGDDAWQYISITFTVSALATQLDLHLWVMSTLGTSNTAWFDAINAVEVCSYSYSSSSASSSSNSFSSEGAHADSFIQEVGSTDNDDGYPRQSYWISGEYTRLDPDVPVDQYTKEVKEITPVILDVVNDINLYVGARDKTDEIITWETIAPFTDQEMASVANYGKYLSFKCVANGLDDFYRISEIMGQYAITGKR